MGGDARSDSSRAPGDAFDRCNLVHGPRSPSRPPACPVSQATRKESEVKLRRTNRPNAQRKRRRRKVTPEQAALFAQHPFIHGFLASIGLSGIAKVFGPKSTSWKAPGPPDGKTTRLRPRTSGRPRFRLTVGLFLACGLLEIRPIRTVAPVRLKRPRVARPSTQLIERHPPARRRHGPVDAAAAARTAA